MQTTTEMENAEMRDTVGQALSLLRSHSMNHADALRLLANLPQPADTTPSDIAARYNAVHGLAHAQAGNDDLALDDLRTSLEFEDAAWHGYPAMPPLISFNMALVLLVGNTPKQYRVPDRAQRSNLHEAVSLFTGVAFQLDHLSEGRWRSEAGAALALLAETLLLLERNDEALDAAERAIPLLNPNQGNQARRQRGCYGIQELLTPRRHNLLDCNPPGTYNREEFHDYRGAW